jgi:hypothetical protein
LITKEQNIVLFAHPSRGGLTCVVDALKHKSTESAAALGDEALFIEISVQCGTLIATVINI